VKSGQNRGNTELNCGRMANAEVKAVVGDSVVSAKSERPLSGAGKARYRNEKNSELTPSLGGKGTAIAGQQETQEKAGEKEDKTRALKKANAQRGASLQRQESKVRPKTPSGR